MRSYEIYKVKKKYLSFIIGRERLLYDLLKDETDSAPAREVTYLCDHIEQQTIEVALQENLGKSFTTVESETGNYRLTHPMKGTIHLSVSPYSVQAYCDGSRMLDLDLFVALSGLSDRYFAVMDNAGEWGWLKPVKYSNRLIGDSSIAF